MRLQEIMSSEVETIAPTASVAAAREKMSFGRIHHLVVVEGRMIEGVVSSRDLKGARADTAVAEVMAPNPVTATPKTTLRDAANLLRGHIIGCLPVVERNRLVGIVTLTDLLDLLGRGAEKPVAMGKRWTLKHRGPRAVQQRRTRVRS